MSERLIGRVTELIPTKNNMLYRDAIDVDNWLKGWTLDANIKAVICDSEEELIERLRTEILNSIFDPGYHIRFKAEDFEFTYSYCKVMDDAFYISNSWITTYDRYPVCEKSSGEK